jgi:hypothetical protein
MGTVLKFNLAAAVKPRERADLIAAGELVIFPGVRVECQELDLSHRLRNCAGREVFHGFGGKQWPAKTF